MADNYLENKMAEYRANGGKRPAQRRASGPRRGVLEIAFPPKRVVVAGPDSAMVRAVAEAFTAAGCRVGILGGTVADGARCFPATADLAAAVGSLMHDWLEVDVLVECGEAPGVAGHIEAARKTVAEPLRAADYRRIHIGPDAGSDAQVGIRTADHAAAARMVLMLVAAPAATGRLCLHI